MANIITISRIFCSLPLLFVPVFSVWFYVWYLLCGLSDMIDGSIARKTGTVSEIGSKLDTIADFVFLTISFSRLFPVLELPKWLVIWIMIIAVIKFSGVLLARKIVAHHSVLNKIAGICLFLLPLSLKIIEVRYSGSVVAAIATVAALQELRVVLQRK